MPKTVWKPGHNAVRLGANALELRPLGHNAFSRIGAGTDRRISADPLAGKRGLGPGDSTHAEGAAVGSMLGLSNPLSHARLGGVTAAPALGEGLSEIR